MLQPPLTHSPPSATEVCPRALSLRGGEPSPATECSPAEGSGGKCTHQGAQEVPLTASACV